ncbi:MAG: carboxynorspermidine decarboxylase [Deltaproteobacteria bacterium RIFOXYD12_FULL_57_12]|nr:MAG: carboxynorspermidine decarboxylase [Deltaproteobacteria bacterium RIFOXYD12_FULL_57_12]
MDRGYPVGLAIDRIPTPCFVVNEAALTRNLAILEQVRQRSGCRILLALKGFAMFSVFPLLRQTLQGVCASSPHEARLGREEFGGEVHTFAAGYSEADIFELLPITDHLVFNSFAQWQRFKPLIAASGRAIACGIRVNPECSTGKVALYDPCAPGSRLGVRAVDFPPAALDGISGLHFHTLCEQNADALALTLQAFEAKFSRYLDGMKWVNFGGGHHITRADYDVDLLCRLLTDFAKKYPHLTIYLEPGEAVALNAGVLAASVLDIIERDVEIAILDISATAHMPDVLEMPYRPEVAGAGLPGEQAKTKTYRLAGKSCLAGDVIGDYSFSEPLRVGSKLFFLDMAHYTMVKTTTFNGMQLPSIALYRPATDEFIIIRRFGYEDFKNRLS